MGGIIDTVCDIYYYFGFGLILPDFTTTTTDPWIYAPYGVVTLMLFGSTHFAAQGKLDFGDEGKSVVEPGGSDRANLLSALGHSIQ